MARQSTYGLDDDINENDLLSGSDYLGTKNNLPGGTPRYATKNFRIRDLSKYFANGGFQDGDFYNLAQISTNVAGNTTSIASINQTLTTHANDISSGAQYSLNLASSFGVADANGNITSLSEAFANLVLNVSTSQDYATASQLTTLQATVNNQAASISSNASDILTVTASATQNASDITTAEGNISTVTTTANANAASITTLTNNLATTNSNVTQSATDITNLTATVTSNTTNITSNDTDITSVTNSAAANASSITTLTNNLATANTSISQNASNVTSLTGTVTTNTTTIAGKPETFRQTSAPAVSEPVGSLWFDTDDGNKAYILVSGSPNVWTAIPDSRIAANATSITTANTNITANASDITTLTNSIATTNANVTQNATNVTNLTSTVNTNTAAITSNDGDITTANTNIAANASSITTLTNNLATANTAISQNATNATSLTSTVSTNTTNITLKPEVFRQNNAPAVTGATGSLWYDTNDSNKLYVLVAGNPKVWTVTDDSRIAANATTISTNTSNITTNASNITTLTNDLDTAEASITQNATNTTNLTSTVSTNSTTIGNKPDVFRQDAAPAVTGATGSLWYDTNDGNKPYVLVAGSPKVWTQTTDAAIAAGDAVNATAITTANTNIATNASNITTLTNDLDTAEASIVNNASNTTSLTTTVNTNTTNIAGKPNVFRQNSAPAVTEPVGSMWFDTNDNNKAYVLVSGSPNVWTATVDTRITTNATNISTLNTSVTNAQNKANANETNITTLTTDVGGKPDVFRQDAAPAVTGATGSLWYDTNDSNKLYVLVAGSPKVWTATVDATIATAQSTADARPKVFRQTSAPATSEPANSIWFDTDDNNKTYVLVSSTWTASDDARIGSTASSLSTLTSTVNGHTTSISTNQSSINGVKAKYGVTINANGALTGYRIIGDTAGASEFIINANDFKIYDSGGNLNPFSVSGSKVQINGDLNVTSAATIGGTATSNDANGRPTALFLKNLGAVSGNDASVAMELQSAARYHHVIEMTGGGGSSGNFDLNAEYRLGKSLVAGNEGDNYSFIVAKMNGAGLIVPNQTANSTTASADYANGMNIIFNDNDGSRTVNSGRMHVSEYFKTFFLDVPANASSHSPYAGRMFSMRHLVSPGGGASDFEDEFLYIDTNEHLHVAEVYDIDNSNLYLDFGNTGDSLKVAGDVVAFVSSDKRYKDNIVNISSPLDKLSKINGVSFTWNEISHKQTGKKDIGVIAQEIEEVLPEIVETRDNGYKAVDYPKLTALLIEAVKELSDKVKKLEDGITG